MTINHLSYFSEDIRQFFIRTNLEPYFKAIVNHLENNFHYDRFCRVGRNTEFRITIRGIRTQSHLYSAVMRDIEFSDINFNDINIHNYFKIALKVGLISLDKVNSSIPYSLHNYACFLTYCLIQEIRNQLPNQNDIPWSPAE